MGQYEDALKLFATVLKDSRTMVTVQVEAAQTYQERGKHEKPAYLRKAITGGYPDDKKENIIWGWNKMAAITQRNPQFLNYFFLARYNAARALFDYGRAEKKREDIELAKRFLQVTHQLYPNLGEPDHTEWRAKYNDLVTDIQKSLGEKPPYGLPKLDAPTPKNQPEQTAKRE